MFFDGNCAEAMRFYEKALGGKLEMMMKASEGPTGEADARRQLPDAVMHAGVLGLRPTPDGFGLDVAGSLSGHQRRRPSRSVYSTVEEATRKFEALAAGGKVVMPLDKTFWVEAFGMLTDKYGAKWMVNGGKPAQ